MNKELKQFKISKAGFEQLSEYNFELLEKARTVVMWYLEASYGRTSDKQTIALNDAAAWTGFKASIEKVSDNENKILLEVANLSASDAKFYISLFYKFKTAIETLKIDEHDELGLMDETIQIANIMLKYRYVIALRRKKKSILYRFANLFSY